MIRFGLHLLLGLFIVVQVSCAQPQTASLFSAQQKLSAEDYDLVLKRWTRSDRVYRDFDTKIFVNATLHSSEFRRAFAVAFPEIFGHGGTITKRELVELSDNVEQFQNFFVAVYTPDDKWNDLDKPDSIWHLTLIGSDDQVAVDPAKIESIKIDANLREVYPYLGRFYKAYLVRFPLADSMQQLVLGPKSTRATLRIASAMGVAKMHWDLEPAEVAAVPKTTEPVSSSEPVPSEPVPSGSVSPEPAPSEPAPSEPAPSESVP